jgi:hypothetical protein
MAIDSLLDPNDLLLIDPNSVTYNAPQVPVPAAPAPMSNPAAEALNAQLLKAPSLKEEFASRKQMYRDILGDTEKQRDMSQAQMLFDIANTAIAFAGNAGSRPGMSLGERLAESVTETKLLPTIGARAQAAQDAQQKLDLAALQSAESSLLAKEKAGLDYLTALAKKTTDVTDRQVKMPDGSIRIFNIKSPQGFRNYKHAIEVLGGAPHTVTGEPADKQGSLVELWTRDGKKLVGTYDRNIPAHNKILTEKLETGDFITADKFSAFEQSRAPSKVEQFRTYGFDTSYVAPETMKSIAKNQAKKLKAGDIATTVVGDQLYMYDKSAGDVEDVQATLTPVAKKTLPVEPYVFTINGEKFAADLNTKAGRALYDTYTKEFEKNPNQLVNSMDKDAQKREFKGFALIDEKTGKETFVQSYDGGVTYLDPNTGKPKNFPRTGATVLELDPRQTKEFVDAEKTRIAGGKIREELDAYMLNEMGLDRNSFAKDAVQMLNDGTGPQATIGVLVDKILALAPDDMQPEGEIGLGINPRAAQQARQYLRGVFVIGRAAFAANPTGRLSNQDVQFSQALGINPDEELGVFSNTRTAIDKVIQLKELLLQRKYQNASFLEQGGLDAGQKAGLLSNNMQIDRLLDMLRTVKTRPLKQGINQDDIDAINDWYDNSQQGSR